MATDSIRDAIIENLIDTMPVGLLVLDKDGDIILANLAISRILGYSMHDLRAKGWGELFYTSDANADFNQVLIDLVNHKQMRLMRSVPYTDPTGEIHWLSITSSYLSRGEELGIVLLMEDVTEKHLLHEHEREMAERHSQLQRERALGLSTLAMNVAHQIRNPVMAIGGFSQLLMRDENLGEASREKLTSILDESWRLERLVGAVHEYAAICAPARKPVSLEALAASALAGMEAAARERGVAVVCPIAGSAQANVDPDQVRRCLSAVLQNALDFSTGSRVDAAVAVHGDEDENRIEISDLGTGIAEADMPYVFDPFFTTKARGVGMGLATARRIMVEHQGDIAVVSHPGQGTRVTLRFPHDTGASFCPV